MTSLRGGGSRRVRMIHHGVRSRFHLEPRCSSSFDVPRASCEAVDLVSGVKSVCFGTTLLLEGTIGVQRDQTNMSRVTCETRQAIRGGLRGLRDRGNNSFPLITIEQEHEYRACMPYITSHTQEQAPQASERSETISDHQHQHDSTPQIANHRRKV